MTTAFSEPCSQCPRDCRASRSAVGSLGFCSSPSEMRISRAAAHFGEEPCISGTKGSGAVFFTGCNLRCCFCQNHSISRGFAGEEISVLRLRDILYRLEDQGVHNINLVTPTHYTDKLAEALSGMHLSIPVVWNSSGYEAVEELKKLKGLIQIYLPDLKYSDPKLALELSAAGDYTAVALSAIREMYHQVGAFSFDDRDLLQKGVMLRHLILPGHIENTLGVLDLIEDTLPYKDLLVSLMAQYTPLKDLLSLPVMKKHPELHRTLTEEEYNRVSDYLFFSDIENGYLQELSASGCEMIPDFDGTGLTV